MPKCWNVIVAAALLLPAAASAHVEGDRLAAVCRQAPAQEFCAGYAAGVFDALVGLRGLGRFHICLPADVTDVELVVAVEHYVAAHAAVSHEVYGIELVMAAWSERWACKSP